MLLRTVAGVILGAALWVFLFMGVGIGVGFLWPEYREAASLMFESDDLSLFTTPMLFINMIVFVAAGLGAGMMSAWLGKRLLPTLILASVFLIMMMVNHYVLVWDELPPWYNLIIPLIIAGAIVSGGRVLPARSST